MTGTVSTHTGSQLGQQPAAASAGSAADLLPVLRPTVATAVTVINGRVLLIKRADTGEWAFPGGGVEPGETPRTTAARETLEETGLRVVPLAVLGQRIHPVTGVCIAYVACWPLSDDAYAASVREVAKATWTDIADLSSVFLHGVFGPACAYLLAGGSSERRARGWPRDRRW
nr:NUDIX domain-containing protein [Streptomyces sp. NBC_00899]